MTMPATLPAMGENPEPRLTVRAIAAIVANDYDVHLSAVVGQTRAQRAVEPRHVAMWLANHHLGASLPQIGRAIGGRDHTTVLFACRKIEERRQEEPDLAARLDHLVARLSQAETEARARGAAFVTLPAPPPPEKPVEAVPAPQFVLLGPTPEEERVLDALAAYLKARDHTVAHQYTVGEAAARRRESEAYRALRAAHDEMLFVKREGRQ